MSEPPIFAERMFQLTEMMQRLLALHDPCPVYEECTDPGCEEEEHLEIDSDYYACTPPTGWACGHCCADSYGYPTECRTHSGDHTGAWFAHEYDRVHQQSMESV